MGGRLKNYQQKEVTITTINLDKASQEVIDVYIKAVLGKKALNVAALDVRKLTSFADYFIICSGRSNRQVTAIGEHIQRELKNQGIRPLGTEGIPEGHWALLDYGHVIIHVFYPSVRELYDIEGLWSDAKRIQIPVLTEPEPMSENDPGDEEAEPEYEGD
jgi:ribosome-associated protein